MERTLSTPHNAPHGAPQNASTSNDSRLKLILNTLWNILRISLTVAALAHVLTPQNTKNRESIAVISPCFHFCFLLFFCRAMLGVTHQRFLPKFNCILSFLHERVAFRNEKRPINGMKIILNCNLSLYVYNADFLINQFLRTIIPCVIFAVLGYNKIKELSTMIHG